VLEISSPHGLPYEVPKGWCGFGLQAQPRAKALNVFKEWAVSFHGTQSSRITSILDNNGLLKPGDVLLDGSRLPNRLTRGGADGKGAGRIGFYTSPSINYSELDIYTTPEQWEGHKVRVVLQCRQMPGSFSVEKETIGWARRFGSAPISKHFSNDKIERFTEAGQSIIPYRILVGLDVTTREEEEEERKKAELEELRQSLAASEKRLKEAQRAKREAQRAKKEAERAEKEAEEAEEEAQQKVARDRAALAQAQDGRRGRLQ